MVVVDDDPDITEFVQRTIEAAGYDVLSAKDGRDCLTILEEAQVACIISDIVMPEMDGVELFKNLAQRKPHIPVVLMSGYEGKYLSNAAMLADINGLKVLGALEKGFSSAELIEVLSKLDT